MAVATNAYVCTPSSLLASTPCLQCISEKEMIAAILGVLALDAGTTVSQALIDGACFTCLSKRQMLQALVTILGNELLGEEHSVPQVIEEIRCLECSSEQQMFGAILKLICDGNIFGNRQ